mgnify:CR=1 FL=1
MIYIVSSIQKSDRGLGHKNDLLYKIPEDMRRFKDLTLGHPVIMGRRTWESLPPKFRPLPNRTNIVVIEEAIEHGKKLDENVAIIGGARIFEEALPYTDILCLTEIEGHKDADVYFPEYKKDFVEFNRVGPFRSAEGAEYYFVDYKKK